MKKKTLPVCERCGTLIISQELGVIVLGNIYAAVVDERLGIVGNAFPTPDEHGMIKTNQIQEAAFCRNCFLEMLGWLEKPETPPELHLHPHSFHTTDFP